MVETRLLVTGKQLRPNSSLSSLVPRCAMAELARRIELQQNVVKCYMPSIEHLHRLSAWLIFICTQGNNPEENYIPPHQSPSQTPFRKYQISSSLPGLRLPARHHGSSRAWHSQGVIRVSLPGDSRPSDLDELVLGHAPRREVDSDIPQRAGGGVLGGA